MNKSLKQAVGIGLVVLSLIGCSTPSSALTPTQAPKPLSSSQIGTTIKSEHWEVTVTDVLKQDRISCLTSTGASGSSAVAPYIYLIVEATIRVLDSSQSTSVSSKDGELITADGKTIPSSGGGSDGNYCMSEVTFKTDSMGFVFLVNANTITEKLGFKFKDMQSIPFSMSEATQP